MTEPSSQPPLPLNETHGENKAQPASAEQPEEHTAIPKASETIQNAQTTAQALTNRALHFLATASNESLGACLVGLGATTYLVLGRVGLVLIGVVGGVVLHATWENQSNGKEGARDHDARRRETGLDVVHRVLKWRGAAAESKEKGTEDDSGTDIKLYSGKNLDYSDFKPQTALALTEFTDAVVRDYVKWWYSPILPTELSFPNAARQTLTAFILSVSSHLSRKRPADTFLDFVTNSSSILIVFFTELSTALAASPSTAPSDAIDTYLQMKPDSNLASVLDPKHQATKLDLVAEDILQNYLEPKTYNCQPARVFLREILAKVILEMTVASCSKPEWINGWIVYLLEDGEPELLNAIDAGVEGSSGERLQNVTNQIKQHEEIVKSEGTDEERRKTANHKRVVSKAQEAMDEAMREAQRLTELIAEEDAKKLRGQKQHASTSSINDDVSESTTQGMATPTSSQSDAANDHDNEGTTSGNASMETSRSVPLEAPSSPQKTAFTSFDQLVPNQPPTALLANPPEKPPPLTLYNANLVIFDDSMPGDKAIIRTKPNPEYLIQIEPSSSHHPGWMIARKFPDFETLHEILRRIATISGVPGFTETHPTLPMWKGHTKASFRGELERYLNDAVRFKPLAESEGMKRFLEKDTGLSRSPNTTEKGGFPGIGWPTPAAFETMGKGMFDILTKAPKEVAGGGKALFGGVTGVLGNVGSQLGPKKSNSVQSTSSLSRSTTASPAAKHARAESTVSELPTHIRTESSVSLFPSRRASQDSLRGSPIVDTQPALVPQMERRPSYNPERRPSSSSYERSRNNSRAPSLRESLEFSPIHGGDQILTLPPPPTDMPDDYGSPTSYGPPLPSRKTYPENEPTHSHHPSRASNASLPLPTDGPTLPARRLSTASTTSTNPPKSARASTTKPPKTYPPFSEQETQVTIELLFAVINELYTLSSAWQIRRTLLNAAKTFLLRPGNPQLDSIRQLLQSTVLDENTSDAGVAFHIRKMRANGLPTEAELKAWPKEMTAEEKERLRDKARRLLVERGMPQALTSVMGQAASGEALGRVFDCLQVETVARGVIFGLLLQGMRAVVQ